MSESERCRSCGLTVTPRVAWGSFLVAWGSFLDGADHVEAICPSCLASLRVLPQTPENVVAADRDAAEPDEDHAL